MRILMIIDGLSGGGAEKVLLTLSQGLALQGHQVSIFSLREDCDYTIPDGIDYQIIDEYSKTPWRKFTELSRRTNTLDKALIVSQQLGGPFDLIFSHLHKTDRIVACSRILPKNKVWFCIHSILSVGYLTNRKGIFRWFKRYKIRSLYQNRNIIAVSHDVMHDLHQSFNVKPSQEKVIFNPFDFTVIRQLSKEPCELAGQEYLIHIGRFHHNKRQDRLLKAYAESGIQAPLLILGKGNKIILQQLQSIAKSLNISDRVLFKGFTRNPYPYIRHARMLILSSDSEGFGNVLIEALTCNTPVVSTCCPGGPKEILKGELSLGLTELNSISLARVMRSIYNKPPKISVAYLQPYDIGEICRQYIALAKKQL